MANKLNTTLDAAFEILKRTAVEHGDSRALLWTLHPGSRARGIAWMIVVPEGEVRSISLSESRQESERIIYALARLFENYSTVTP